jgi:two-component system response regulator GlrR
VDAQLLDQDLTLVEKVRALAAGCPVIAVIEGLDAAQIHALLCAGVYDFISTSSRDEEIVARVHRACGLFRMPALPDMRAALTPRVKNLVGTSPAFMALVAKLPTFAGCDAGVLVLGETGTGKEVCAQAIHYLSARASKPWVALNCGAIPTELLESELFGHAKGAYTMAYHARKGLVGEAEGGTLFLDDVDCLPLVAQAKLLRFLEEREYRPLGSNVLCHADVRVVAASNDNLPGSVARGAFRQDLYFRLSVLALKLPPLRERREDIPALASYFVAQFARQFSRAVSGLSPAARHKLLLHHWPGNVRELKHAIERAVLMASTPTLQPADLDIDLDPDASPAEDNSFGVAKSKLIETFERNYIELALARCNGNVSHAARFAKKNRRAFFQLMRKHRIDASRFRTEAH